MNISMSKLLRVIPAIISVFAIANCGGGSGSSTAAPVYVYNGTSCVDQANPTVPVSPTLCTNNGYTYNGTQCIQTSTNTAVPVTYCQQSTLGTGLYSYSGANCVVTANPTQIVSPTLCQQSTLGVTGLTGSLYGGVGGVGAIGGVAGYGATPCIGYYLSSYYGWIYCNGYNCSGQTMESQTGAVVRCM